MEKEKVVEGVKIPYVMAYGNIGKTLQKIVQAARPERFTQDFLATKLSIKGGSAKAVIPFLKRTGFLNSDGTPTELYNQFRNETLRSAAAAKAIRQGFVALYEMNEYAHDLEDKNFKALVVQATGAATDSSLVKAITGSFKELKAFASFDEQNDTDAIFPETEDENTGKASMIDLPKAQKNDQIDFKLGYIINLNLPATTDIAVYNAIFKSLKDHLLNQ